LAPVTVFMTPTIITVMDQHTRDFKGVRGESSVKNRKSPPTIRYSLSLGFIILDNRK
jgi:hypothetical protein